MAERSKFSALLTGVMAAVQKAAVTAGQQNLHVLQHYFNENDDGTLEAKYARVEIAPGQVMDIPLICLMEPSGYRLDELEMDLSVRMKLDAVKAAIHGSVEAGDIKKGSYSVELCPPSKEGGRRRSDVVDVRVKFKSTDPAEGLNRIIEDFNNTITPVPKTSAPDRKTLTIRANRTESDFHSAVTPVSETAVTSEDTPFVLGEDTPPPGPTDWRED